MTWNHGELDNSWTTRDKGQKKVEQTTTNDQDPLRRGKTGSTFFSLQNCGDIVNGLSQA